MNPAVTFKPSGPPSTPQVADPGPLPTIKVDLTPQPGTGRQTQLPAPPPDGEEVQLKPGPRDSQRRMIQELRRYRRQAWEAKQEAQAARQEAETSARDAEWARSVRALPKEEKVQIASALGLSYDDFTQAILSGKKPLDENAEKLRQVQENVENLRQELQKERETAAESVYKASIARHVFGQRNRDRYPLLTTYADEGALNEVFEYVRLAYENENRKVSIKRAAQAVERELDRLARKAASYVTNQGRPARSDGQRRPAPRPFGENGAPRAPSIRSGAPPAGRAGMSGGRPERRQMFRGLSNRMTGSAAAFDRSKPAKTDAERHARAMAILQSGGP